MRYIYMAAIANHAPAGIHKNKRIGMGENAMKEKLSLLLGIVFTSTLLLAEDASPDEQAFLDLATKTGRKYVEQINVLSSVKLPDKIFDGKFDSPLAKAMLSILETHIKHPELYTEFDEYKEKAAKNQHGTIDYTRGDHAFITYIYTYERGKPNPEYRKFMDEQAKKGTEAKSKENETAPEDASQKHNVDSKGNADGDDKGRGGIPATPKNLAKDDPKKALLLPKDYVGPPPKYLPLPKEKIEKKRKRASWARIRLLEYALKETHKPHELHGILLNNPYIKPEKEDVNYESAKTLYDYCILRYIYSLDTILSEMWKRDERFNKVYDGKPYYMYMVERSLNLLDENKLYGTISLLEALRERFEVNPDKNKIIINAINKKIEEFRGKNAKDIQWSGVFERVE